MATVLMLMSTWSQAVTARPLALADVLAEESYGDVTLDPAGRIAIIARRERYDSATYFGFGYATRRLVSRLFIVDLARPQGLQPLFPPDRGTGYWQAGFSPSGERLAVFRIAGRTLSLGIVDMTSRATRWFTLRPDLPLANPNPVWLDDGHLLIAVRGAYRLPTLFVLDRAHARLTNLWATAASGHAASATAIDSGDGEMPPRIPSADDGVALLDVARGQSSMLSKGAAILDLALSPDYGNLAIVTAGRAHIPAPDAVLGPDFVDREPALDIVNIATRSLWHVSKNVFPNLLAWRRDGQALLVATPGLHATPPSFLDVRPQDRRILRLGTRESPTIMMGDRGPKAGWLGHAPVAQVMTKTGARYWQRLDRASQPPLASAPQTSAALRIGPERLLLARDGHLLSVRSDGRRSRVRGQFVAASAALDPFARGTRVALNPDTDTSAAAIFLEANKLVVRFAPEDRTGLPIRAGNTRLVAASRPAGAALLVATNRFGVGTLQLERDGATPLVLDRINAQLGDVTPLVPIPIETRMSDGRRHRHWLILPPGRTGLPPLIVVPYPGRTYDAGPPSGVLPDHHEAVSLGLLAAHGYAVLVPSIPAQSSNRHPLDQITADIERATLAAIATGRVDRERTAIWGHSYGGYGALAVATRSRRYRAIIASSGFSDLVANYAALPPPDRIDLHDGVPLATSIGWSEGGQAAMGAPPWVRPGRYIAASPYFSLARIRTPLLLIAGDEDAVPVSQSERLFVGLDRLGRRAELVRYFGEGHVMASPANIADEYARVFAWLDRWLRPRAAPVARRRSA